MISFHHKSGVYLVAFYPSPETTPENKQDMHLAYSVVSSTYNCNYQLITEPEEALDLHCYPYVAIEEKNQYTTPLNDFIHPEKAVYVVGNSKYRWPSGWIDVDHKVHIPVPNNEPLYGHQAATIVLHERYMKHGTSL